MQRLSEMLELREMHSGNLDTTSSSLEELVEVVKLVEEANSSLDAIQVEPYDHNKCPDCGLMPILATQCIDDLNALMRRQAEARVWLQQLNTCKGRVEKAKVQLDKSMASSNASEGEAGVGGSEGADETEPTE
jgi:hypothetical protein